MFSCTSLREKVGEAQREKRGDEDEDEDEGDCIRRAIVIDESVLHYSAAQGRWLGGRKCENVYLDNTQKHHSKVYTLCTRRYAQFDVTEYPAFHSHFSLR